MRIVVAPDKFSGSLTATQAAAAVAAGLLDVLPDAAVVQRPVADGGDGTLDALVTAGWSSSPVAVHGPTGLPVTARIARRGDTAVVELAECCGRGLLPGGVPDPLRASTFGLGEAILAAAGSGAGDVVATVGGSASTDGGLGLLRALGVTVHGPDGEITAPADLVRAERIDVSRVAPTLRTTRLTLATDVAAPLTGRSGAARLFGLQKGATPQQIETLEWAMWRWGDLLAEHSWRRVGEQPSAGAAGGVVAGALGALHDVLPVRVAPGAQFVLDAIGLDAELARADVVVVGEGSLDRQTLLGKAPFAVAQAARRHGCRVVAVAGRVELDARGLDEAGIGTVLTLDALAGADGDPLRDAAVLARRAGLLLGSRITA